MILIVSLLQGIQKWKTKVKSKGKSKKTGHNQMFIRHLLVDREF